MIRKRRVCFCLVAFGMLLSISGCTDPVRSKIVGTWEIQKADRLSKRINQEQAESDSRMRIVIQKSGAIVTQTSMGEIQREKTGSWKLVSFDQEAGKMEIACDLGSGEVNTAVRFVDDNTISLVPPNMAGTKTKLKFVRKQ